MFRLFILQSLVITLIAYLYVVVGLEEGLVFRLWWFDILLHLLGGFWSVLALAWFFSFFGIRLSFWQLFACGLAVGLAWEAFEYAFDIGGSNFMSYQADTAKDLIDDCLGGSLGAYLALRLLRA